MDTDRIRKLKSRPDNEQCADCTSPDVSHASLNLGVLVCSTCADVHRSLGSQISQVKSLEGDSWSEQEIRELESKGNRTGKDRYEQAVPVYYRQPTHKDKHVLLEQWIRAKYERKEFVQASTNRGNRPYESGRKEGFLWKRGKEDKRYQRRWFVLDASENTLRYYNGENMQEPKGTYRLDGLNIALVPYKLDNPNGMQIIHSDNRQTRSLFVYAETGQDVVEWYTSVRYVKLQRLLVTHPDRRPEELSSMLTRDFLKEGWLSKTGPSSRHPFRRRWMTLDQRKLLYSEDMLDAFPKGEIPIGSQEQGFAVRVGVPPGQKDQGFSFTLKTPERRYFFSAETAAERSDWVELLRSLIAGQMNV